MKTAGPVQTGVEATLRCLEPFAVPTDWHYQAHYSRLCPRQVRQSESFTGPLPWASPVRVELRFPLRIFHGVQLQYPGPQHWIGTPEL